MAFRITKWHLALQVSRSTSGILRIPVALSINGNNILIIDKLILTNKLIGAILMT